MFGIKFVATKCKECYFDHLVIELAMFITMRSACYICTKYNTEPRSCSEIFKLVLRCSE